MCLEKCPKPVLLLLKPLDFTPLKKVCSYMYSHHQLCLSVVLIYFSWYHQKNFSHFSHFLFNLLTSNVPIIQKPVSWFALQNWFLYDGNLCCLKFFADVLVSIKLSTTRIFAFVALAFSAHTFMTSTKNDQLFDPSTVPHAAPILKASYFLSNFYFSPNDGP